MTKAGYILLGVLLINSCTGEGRESHPEYPFPIPYCNTIVVDGRISDWDSTGLRIPLISNLYGDIDTTDFLAELKLAWNEQGLYFMVTAEDDQLIGDRSVLRGDGMEIFISQEKGSGRIIHYVIAPPVTSEYDQPRIEKNNYQAREISRGADDVCIQSSATAWGYMVEGAIPFSSLGIDPFKSENLAVNIYLSDVDQGERKTRYAIYFNQDTWSNFYAVQEIMLDTATGESEVPLLVKAYIEDLDTFKIRLISNLENSGKRVTIKGGSRINLATELERQGNYSYSGIDLPVSNIDSSVSYFSVDMGKDFHAKIYLRDFSHRFVRKEKPNRFEDEILMFEALDRFNPPPKHGILFIGSSSIRLWKSTIDDDFKGSNVICRGFGGSRTQDALTYFDRIVTPYAPSVIILAEGSNDIASGDTPEEIVNYTRQFIVRADKEIPGTRVIILSIKVSIARERNTTAVLRTNRMLKEMVAEYSNAEYVDVVSEMLTANGKVRRDIFLADSLHMNAMGYEIWTRILSPVINSKGLPGISKGRAEE